MKAALVRHEKFSVRRRRYLIEITVHQVAEDARYRDRLKWSLICIDRISGKRVLMDNHHPKGPHQHIDDVESLYQFSDLDTLVSDFRKIILDHMGVQI